MTTMQYFNGIRLKYWSNPIEVLEKSNASTVSILP